jgi:Uma2 family endonuclease
MSVSTVSAVAGEIFYPENDGQPMSESIRQLNWIIALVTNLRTLFRDNPEVLVAGNQFWYPVEGEAEIRMAPDVYVVFGRPKGIRGSYQQWKEGGVPMTVVWEVLSPSNTPTEMADKFAFYEDYGAEEYYVYDPDKNHLFGYIRRGEVMIRVRKMNGYVSPRLGIQFDLSGPELVVRYPDGRAFVTLEELETTRVELEAERIQAVQRAEKAEQRAARTAELALKVMRQEATPDEVQELQRLLQPTPPNGK